MTGRPIFTSIASHRSGLWRAALCVGLWIFLGATAMAQEHGDTTFVTRDTLVPSWYQIHHKPLQAGFEGSYGWRWYWNANLQAPVALVGCDQYSTGTGNAFSLRAVAELPLWGDASPWSFEPSIFFESQKPSFSWYQPLKTFDPSDNNLVPFTIQHEARATMDEAGFGGAIEYELAPRFYLNAGADLGILLVQHYETSLHRVEAGSLFSDGARDTITGIGTISKKLAVVPALSVGMSYEMPISETIRARPGIRFGVPFGGDAAGKQPWFLSMSWWRATELNANLSLLFDLTPRSETVPIFERHTIRVPVPPLPPAIEPAPAVKPALTASIHAVAVSNGGERSNVVRMTIEEVRTRNADPILNYIFFAPGSDQFPVRYVQYASPEEAQRQFQGSTSRNNISLMDLYRETLNILGDRLRKYPSANLTLIGSTDNADDRTADTKHGDRTPNELLALARSRAEAVRDYLIHVWQINPKRITVEGTLLPDKPSPSTTEEGRAENRRVAFLVKGNSPNDLRVMAPIIVTNLEHLATPDQILLQPSVHTTSGILRTYASISAGGTPLQTFSGTAKTEQTEKIWAPTETSLKKLRDSLEIDYDVWDSSGNHVHAHSSIPLNIIHIQSNKPERIERFSLILFSFDEAALNANNERSIHSAAELIPTIPVRHVLIQGYTDETGNAEHNNELSSTRATAVRNRLEDFLRAEGATLPANIHTEGLGSREPLYDNRLPEGRFFSRTVNITIERKP